MMRVLAAMLAILGLLAMAPAGQAGGATRECGASARWTTQHPVTDGAQAPCMDGAPCLYVCAVCFPATAGQMGKAVATATKAGNHMDSLATFDLSWRLYRPPKAA